MSRNSANQCRGAAARTWKRKLRAWLRLRLKTFNYRRLLGRAGEWIACRYLQHAGYEIWMRNWRCKFGELDLIAFKEHTLVLVEVKTRLVRSAGAFSPFDSINRVKTAHISAAAREFAHTHKRQLKLRQIREARADAVGISLEISRAILPMRLQLEHLPGGAEQCAALRARQHPPQ